MQCVHLRWWGPAARFSGLFLVMYISDTSTVLLFCVCKMFAQSCV